MSDSPDVVHPRVFFDVSISGTFAGRIIFELFTDITPVTCENFRCLCTGERGSGVTGKPLHFKNIPFHRIIPEYVVQGGDIIFGDGRGGESIYGRSFADENYTATHSSEGLLSMNSSRKDDNSSQFLITLIPAPWLDRKHVVFGRVIEGMEIVRLIEQQGTRSGSPAKVCTISDCGQI
jgi:peptidylprolyl isomerase